MPLKNPITGKEVYSTLIDTESVEGLVEEIDQICIQIVGKIDDCKNCPERNRSTPACKFNFVEEGRLIRLHLCDLEIQ